MITAHIPYTVDTGETLVNETFGPNNIRRRRSGTLVPQPVSIIDGRGVDLELERNGFILVEHQTAVADFFDPKAIESVYFPEVERLIKATSGAARVVIFDHTLRSGDEGEREAKLIREPVLSAHNDYTEKSGPIRCRAILENAMLDIMYEIPSRPDIRKCVVSGDCVTRRKRPLLVTESGQVIDEEPKIAESA